MESKNEVANVNGLRKIPSFLILKLKNSRLFCLCCILFLTSAHKGQRAQILIIVSCKNWWKSLEDLDNHATLSYYLTSMTKMQLFFQTMEIRSSRIDSNIISNEVNRIKKP